MELGNRAGATQVAVVLYCGLVEFVAPVVELAAVLAQIGHLSGSLRFIPDPLTAKWAETSWVDSASQQ